MPSHQDIIPWNSTEGRKRLLESKYHRAFFALCHAYQPQLNPTYCGIASAVIVLNAFRAGKTLRIDSGLRTPLPKAKGGGAMEFNAYSQLTLLNRETDRVKCRKKVRGNFDPVCPEGGGFDPGLGLRELAHKLRLYLLEVSKHSAQGAGDEAVRRFRHDLMAFLNDPDVFMIANYDGKLLERGMGGHFSPLAAYHQPSDSCLVMDVAGHKQPWFWVKVARFYEAMHSRDGQRYRGYLLVSDRLRQ